jgi:alcohol dehydrogenase class IV
LARVAQALGGQQANEAGPLLYALNRALGIPASLAEIGMPAEGLDEAADLACRNPYANPRPIERDAIRALLQRAWQGAEPA